MNNSTYQQLLTHKQNGKKQFAILIDPDKANDEFIAQTSALANECKADYFFVGGSLVMSNKTDDCIIKIKQQSNIPVVLFPGSPSQVSKHANALFYLSLVSGRNADLLIGQHVLSAYQIKHSGLEIIPTGYLVIDGGVPTSVSYISNANPIPANKADIAMCTAMAAEMLGMKVMYMDAGSGALNPISNTMISKVASAVNAPIIVGGGITTAQQAIEKCQAGANVIVVGNAIEKEVSLIKEMCEAIQSV